MVHNNLPLDSFSSVDITRTRQFFGQERGHCSFKFRCSNQEQASWNKKTVESFNATDLLVLESYKFFLEFLFFTVYFKCFENIVNGCTGLLFRKKLNKLLLKIFSV